MKSQEIAQPVSVVLFSEKNLLFGRKDKIGSTFLLPIGDTVQLADSLFPRKFTFRTERHDWFDILAFPIRDSEQL